VLATQIAPPRDFPNNMRIHAEARNLTQASARLQHLPRLREPLQECERMPFSEPCKKSKCKSMPE